MTSTITPVGSRWATRLFAKRAAGSSLTIAADSVSYVGPSAHPSDGWHCVVGTGPLQLARIVHVTGALVVGAKGATVEVDHFAFCSADGHELSAGLSTGRADVTTGWYPPERVHALAEAAGVVFSTDEVITPRELRTKYPRLIAHEGYYVTMVRLNEVVYLIMGLGLLLGTCDALLRHGPVWAILATAFGGVVFCSLGLMFDPKVLTSLIARRKQDKFP